MKAGKKWPMIALATVLLIACISVFRYCHPTHNRFNDRYVLGSTREQIVERYGEPHRESEHSMTYMIRDDTPELVMGYDNSLWYVIVFQQNVASEVYLREGYPGG